PVNFGQCLTNAKAFGDPSKLDSSAWGVRFFGRVLDEDKSAGNLDEINRQRNNLAHGRQSLPLAKIKKLVVQGLQLDAWEQIPETDGELRLVDWGPWVAKSITDANKIGLLERWQKNSVGYLIPETGEVFKVPRY